MDTVMYKFYADGTSAAFRSSSGEFVFTADTSGKWQLLRNMSSTTHLNDNEQLYQSSGDEYHHFMIDCKIANMTRVDGTILAMKPSIITIIQGISSEYHGTWMEYEVRRYALLSKLFGEASAQTGNRHILSTSYLLSSCVRIDASSQNWCGLLFYAAI